MQLQAAFLQAFAHGPGQALGEAAQALAQQLQRALGMLAGQAGLQARQALAAIVQLAFEGPRQAHFQVIQALCVLAQAFAGVAQAPGQSVQAQAFALQAVVHAHDQAALQAVQALHQLAGVGGQQFGGGRGGWRTHVGDEIADGDVGFVAHGADDRRDAGRYRARHGFFVETPEVFQGAAAAGQDQGIEALAIGQLQGTDDLAAGIQALHGGGDQGQGDLRGAAAEHADDVANDRAGRRADDADAPGVGGQGDFAFSGEQAFAAEFVFQGFEGQTQGAVAGRLDAVEDQLVIAAPFEQRDLAAHLDRQAIAQRLTHPRGVLSEQRAAHLGLTIFKGEVDMPGSRLGQVGNLPLDPDAGKYILQQQARTVVELADAEHFAVEVQALERVFDHVRHDKGFAGPAI